MMIDELFSAEQVAWCRRHLGAAVPVAAVRVDLAALEAAGAGEAVAAGRYLTPAEQETWACFRLPRRRLEWLGGRIAAKYAAMAVVGADRGHPRWQGWQVGALDGGRPVLVAGATPLAEISISHSHGMAVALAATRPCGIDIELPREAVLRVRSRFCSAPEEERLAATLAGVDAEMRLTLLWAAKEAVRKALVLTPLASFLEVELLEVQGGAEGLYGLTLSFRRAGRTMAVPVVARRQEGMAVALALAAVA